MNLSSKVQLGVPSRNSGFSGLLIEANVPVLAIFLGGAIAVGIVWIATQAKRSARPVEVEPAPSKLGVTRAAVSNN